MNAGDLVQRQGVALLTARLPSGSKNNRPRTDIDLLVEQLNAHAVPPAPKSMWSRVERLAGSDFRHAASARSGSPSVYVSFAERVAAPAALLDPDANHVCVAHNFNARRQVLQCATHWMERMDSIFVLSSVQRELICRRGPSYDSVKLLLDYVDTKFFDPELIPGPAPCNADAGFVLSVGQELRDFETLIGALKISGLPAVLVPSSEWVSNSGLRHGLPGNVLVRTGLAWHELRDLYCHAAVVAVPIKAGTMYAAGVNGLLEALAMSRRVVVSDTPGLRDHLDSTVMRVVRAGDATQMASALQDAVEDSKSGKPIAAARQRVLKYHTLEGYVAALVKAIQA